MSNKQKTGIALIFLLTVIGFICCFFNFGISEVKVVSICTMAIYALDIFYVAVEYKRPHGNLLKYLMLVFAVSLIPAVVLQIKMGTIPNVVILIISIVMISFMSGRLDRINENKYFCAIVFLLLLATRLITVIKYNVALNFTYGITIFSHVIQWFILCCSYIVRYQQHKDAGK